jgi:hypothetical protein
MSDTGIIEACRKRDRVSAVVYKRRGGGDYAVRPPFGFKKKEWIGKLKKALASDSKAFLNASLHRLLAACHLHRHMIPTSVSISAALALIESLDPKNEIEAALAIEIACLHAACGNLLGRLAHSSQERPTLAVANATAKLERALHSAITTFFRLKYGNTQIIRVEKLEVQPGGQALVGQLVGRSGAET